eukprot:403372601
MINQESRLSNNNALPVVGGAKTKSVASMSQDGDIQMKDVDKELDVLLQSRFESLILKPTNIAKIWDSSHMKEDLILIFQEYFKPKSSIEQEKVEYNEINIFSEYQLYNLIYAKNELLLSNYKCAVLLDKFWQLLEFNPDGNQKGPNYEEDEMRGSRIGTANSGIHQEVQQQEELSPEQIFANLLSHKFSLFKSLCMQMINEPEKLLKFTVEEVKRIADYAKDSYFKHLRLYDYVLNNKQLCEVKRLTHQLNTPIIATNLNDALLLGSEEMLGYEDEDEELRLEIIRKKLELQQQKREEEERRARQQALELEKGRDEDSDEDLKGIDERLKQANIHKESKIIIHQKMQGIDGQIQKTLEERGKQLEDKIGQATGAKKK